MKKTALGLLFILANSVLSQSAAQQESDLAAINSVLNQYHAAAATANWTLYFELMSEDGVFLGSDISERWTREEFRVYAGASNGWVYTPQERHITITPDGNSAWFDERLSSASYGSSRSTGVLNRSSSGWRISQYSLSFPIPNALLRDMTNAIKAYEAQQ